MSLPELSNHCPTIDALVVDAFQERVLHVLGREIDLGRHAVGKNEPMIVAVRTHEEADGRAALVNAACGHPGRTEDRQILLPLAVLSGVAIACHRVAVDHPMIARERSFLVDPLHDAVERRARFRDGRERARVVFELGSERNFRCRPSGRTR